jgi:hypothetical protein
MEEPFGIRVTVALTAAPPWKDDLSLKEIEHSNATSILNSILSTPV